MMLESIWDFECEQCLWHSLFQASLAGTFWNTSKGPSFLGAEETPEASPVQMRKEQRKGRRTEPEATSTHSQPQLPRKGEIPDLDNLWSNRKRKAEMGSLPHCPVAEGKSMALCTEVHTGPQTLGPRAGLQEGGRGW